MAQAPRAASLDIRQLTGFAATAETGSAAAAAELIGCRPAHVSAQIRALEQKLETGRLFGRDARRGDLTEVGQALLGQAYPLLRRHLGLLAAASGLRHARCGCLPFGAETDSFHIPERAQLVERFLAANPGVSLQLSEGRSQDVLRSLDSGAVDVALALVPKARTGYAAYRVLEVRRSVPWLLLPAGHRLAQGDALVQLTDLAGLRLAVPPRSANPDLWDRCLAPFAAAGAELVPGPEWSADALIGRVIRSGELTILPDWLVPGPQAAGGQVAVRSLSHAIAFDDLCLVARGPADSPLAERFLASAQSLLGRPPAPAARPVPPPRPPDPVLGQHAARLHADAIDAAVLRALVTVADTGSFTRAAALLFTSQPWLSTRIRGLEEQLGLALFDRTARGTEVTADGRVLLPQARAMLAALEDCAGQLVSGVLQRSVPLRIGAPTYTLNLPGREQLVERLAASAGVLEVRNGYGAQLIAGLLQGTLDAVVLPEPLDHPGIVTTGLGDLEISHVMLPDGLPCAARDEVSPSDLCGVRMAVFRRELNPGLYDSMMTPFLDAGVVPVPMNGVLGEGIAYAGAALGLAFLPASGNRSVPAGYVRRPLTTPLRTRIVLGVRDEHPWAPQLQQLWEIASEIDRALL